MRDDDVQLDPERPRVAVDADPLAAKDAAHARAGRQADDAVATERPLGDDLRHRLTGDREPAVLQVQGKVVRHGSGLDPKRGLEGCSLTSPQILCEARTRCSYQATTRRS